MINNYWLFVAALMTDVASLLHILIIIGGASWYRFFGAGEKMASMAQRGSCYPGTVTAMVSAGLFIWGLYAFAGSGVIGMLPYMKFCLVSIAFVFLLRALCGLVYYFAHASAQKFMLYSSLICLLYGFLYSYGTFQVWPQL